MDTVDTAALRATVLDRCRAEEEAVTIRSVSGFNLPEQLMIPAFAQLVWECRASYLPAFAAIGAALLPRRRAVLDRPSPARAVFVMGEEAVCRLERGQPDPEIAAAQLRALQDRAGAPHVSVVIHPRAAPALPFPAGRFVITTDIGGRHTAYEEAAPEPSGLLITSAPRRVQVYQDIFDRLCADSLDESGSQARIEEALRRRHRAVTTVPDTR
ncbi:Scr1 family TA system antitoxin-like transcriptional regulator [Amycolatopsis alba]|uniref:Scr1 family TA system antitoxin-like transcriptional regulator n=1 Tax=Amycolatopsis alba TaxID=76020 RepID=UPI0003A44027|nr:Scr1 family TA system antitoxin-like transcriptional regulator [Amycolatopsis alba]